MAITFGNVTEPSVDHRDIANSTAFNDLGQRVPRGFVLHRMLGSLWGTDAYFRSDALNVALTDYGVGAQTGEIVRWNDPLGRRAPWASGPWFNPPGDGQAFVAKFGVNAINRDLISIETDGQYDDTVSAKGYAAIVALIAYWSDYMSIPAASFPINPATGLTALYWHCEFNSQKPCPGPVIKAHLDQIIADVKATLAKYQGGDAGTTAASKPASPAPTIPADRDIPGFLVGAIEWDGRDQLLGKTKAVALHREWKVATNTPVYQYADPKSKQVGQLTSGATVDGFYVLRSDADHQLWVLSAQAGRVPLSALVDDLNLGKAA